MMFGIEKTCLNCSKKILENKNYSISQWKKQKFCGRKCMGENQRYDYDGKRKKFHKSYVIDKETGCWEWSKAKCEKGYGFFSVFGYSMRAHRASWFFKTGVRVAENLQVCHKCDNPPCVNPDHLFLGTAMDNNMDKISKGRQRNLRGSKMPNAILNEETALFILNSKDTAVKLAPILGVSETAVRNVRQGKTWKHVRREE